ncbi:MAG: TonB-dependent receptor, partial [Bacteroidales bacterium]|nr:TonB-dependent receptor [Bacteroidales bacterium]
FESKTREYDDRLVNVIIPRPETTFNRYAPLDSIFNEKNFYFSPDVPKLAGLAYNDGTKAKNSYTGETNLLAGYIGLKIPIFKKVYAYGGARVEKYLIDIKTGEYIDSSTDSTARTKRDTLNIFPSVNLVYSINEKNIIRASYGKTINRAEFRELAPSDYEDFDLEATTHGNPDSLKFAYINNYEIRYEWYPSSGEMVSLAGFYKDFENPIELFQRAAGTGFDYFPINVEKAKSYGIEFDARKSFMFLEGTALNALKDFTVVFNTSLIKSEIKTDLKFLTEKKRVLQGQSPYIINLGLYYQNEKSRLMVNLSYNRIGKRIVFTGTSEHPHTYEIPRDLVDLSINKGIGKRLELKLGIKDLFSNQPYEFVQYFGKDNSIPQKSTSYLPNRKITLGLSLRI